MVCASYVYHEFYSKNEFFYCKFSKPMWNGWFNWKSYSYLYFTWKASILLRDVCLFSSRLRSDTALGPILLLGTTMRSLYLWGEREKGRGGGWQLASGGGGSGSGEDAAAMGLSDCGGCSASATAVERERERWARFGFFGVNSSKSMIILIIVFNNDPFSWAF